MYLTLFLIAPSAIMVAGGFSSLAQGLIIVCISYIPFIVQQKKVKLHLFHHCLLGFTLSSVIFVTFQYEVSFDRKYELLLAPFIIFFKVVIFANYYVKLNTYTLQCAIKISYWILSILGLAATAGFNQISFWSDLNNPVPPFSEPSHYALVYLPIATAFIFISSKYLKIASLFLLLYLSLMFPSLVLLVGTLLIAILVLSRTYLLCLLGLFFGVILLNYDTHMYHYFYDRIFDDSNLSRLVFMQGWDMAHTAVMQTSGVGFGFQNIASLPVTSTGEIIYAIAMENLNLNDGGFVASKLIVEFGALGLAAVILAIILSIKSFLRLNLIFKNKTQANQTKGVFSLIFSTFIIIELFLRGVGYFSPSFIIYLALLPSAIKFLRNPSSNGVLISCRRSDNLI